jgi:hypothetical protein
MIEEKKMICGSTRKELSISIIWVLGCFILSHYSILLLA